MLRTMTSEDGAMLLEYFLLGAVAGGGAVRAWPESMIVISIALLIVIGLRVRRLLSKDDA